MAMERRKGDKRGEEIVMERRGKRKRKVASLLLGTDVPGVLQYGCGGNFK